MHTSSDLLSLDLVHAEVRDRTSLDLPDDPALLERVSLLLHHANDDLKLTGDGQAAMLEAVTTLLSGRTQLMADRDRYPEIAAEEIARPIFVAGLARSGTTLMQSLLAEMPGNRLPQFSEVAQPSPPPGLKPDDAHRDALGDRLVEGLMQTNPTNLVAHPYLDALGETPIECAGFGALDFRNTYAMFYFDVPAPIMVDLGADFGDVGLYKWEHLVLQNLQWQREPKRWVLKGVHHHARLDPLKAAFPDSTVIWMHRDPQRVVPSMLELIFSFYESVSPEPLDREWWGQLLLALIGEYAESGLASNHLHGPGVIHVLYNDFIKDPVETIRSIYGRAELAFTDVDAAAIEAWLDNDVNGGTRYGKFEYSLDSVGISADQIEAVLGRYRMAFDIPFD